jgi:hypothetical protein
MKNRLFLAFVMIAFSIIIYEGCNQKQSDTNITQPPTGNQQTIEPNQNIYDKESAPKSENRSNTAADLITISTQDKQLNEQNIYNTPDKRMIIKSGTMSLEVDKYDESETKIREISKKYNGYITNTSATLNPNGKKQGTISIRVPSEKFDGLLNELRQTGKEMNENINGKDVTEEYMDAEARLKTQQQLEDRLLKLLSEKTAKLTDIVEVEQKLSGVRENIERTEGRMKYLKDQSSYSTLAVSVYEPSLLTTSTGGGFFYEIEQSFKKGLNGFTAVLSGIITIVIALMPILVIGFVIVYLVVRYFNKRKKAKTVPVPNTLIAEKNT